MVGTAAAMTASRRRPCRPTAARTAATPMAARVGVPGAAPGVARAAAPTAAPTVRSRPSSRQGLGHDVRGWARMSRWDALLSVQEHDTAVDQLVHRRAHLPARAELDDVMGELTRIDAAAKEVEARRHDLARNQQ